MLKRQNSGRKHSVLRDELHIHGPGIYAFTPYENTDRWRRMAIKIGESSRLERRTNDYSTYFPSGVYLLGFLTDIKGPLATRSSQKKTPRELRHEIEEFIMHYVETHDKGKRLYSTDRIKRPNNTLEGQTEWVFSRVENVHAALQEASIKYRANVQLYYLEGLNPDTGRVERVQDPNGKSIYKGIVKF